MSLALLRCLLEEWLGQGWPNQDHKDTLKMLLFVIL